jgi:hypothetical protein
VPFNAPKYLGYLAYAGYSGQGAKNKNIYIQNEPTHVRWDKGRSRWQVKNGNPGVLVLTTTRRPLRCTRAKRKKSKTEAEMKALNKYTTHNR